MEQWTLYDRATGATFKAWPVIAQDILNREGERYGRGEVCPPDELFSAQKRAAATRADHQAPEADLRVMAGEPLPMPADSAAVGVGEAAPLTPPVADADNPIAAQPVVGNGPVDEHFALPIDNDGQARAMTPLDKTDPQIVEAAEDSHRDGTQAQAKAVRKVTRSPEEKRERAEVIESLRRKGVTFFAGSSTDDLKKQLAEA